MTSEDLNRKHIIERYILARKNVCVKLAPDLPREKGKFLKAYAVSKSWLALNRPDLL